MITIDYQISKNYCSDWSVYDAIREIVQNAVDSGQEFECFASDMVLQIRTKNVTLDPKVFALGESHKDGDSIGKYGEGLKIAMMVLEREGFCPTIENGSQIIAGEFRMNSVLGVETFVLNFEEDDQVSKDLVIDCIIPPGKLDRKELERRITYFGEPLPTPERVDILQNGTPDIYVNGLYVTDFPGLTFGYNFHPNYITLNRDRNMAHGVTWQLGEYYSQHENADLVYNLLMNEALDVSDIHYFSLSLELQKQLADRFTREHGDATIMRTGRTISTGSIGLSAAAFSVFKSIGIKTKEEPKVDAPHNILEKFLQDNRNKLRRDVRNEFSKIITLAKGWRGPDIL